MKSQDTKQHIKTTNHPQIIKTTNLPAILTSLGLIVIGTAGIFLSAVMGVTLMIVGIALFIIKNKRKVYEKTGSTAKLNFNYVHKNILAQLETMLTEGNFRDAIIEKFEDNGNAKIEYILSQDKQFAAVQLSEYIPFTYEPYTSIFYFTGDKAVEFAEYLDKCKAQK